MSLAKRFCPNTLRIEMQKGGNGDLKGGLLKISWRERRRERG